MLSNVKIKIIAGVNIVLWALIAGWYLLYIFISIPITAPIVYVLVVLMAITTGISYVYVSGNRTKKEASIDKQNITLLGICIVVSLVCGFFFLLVYSNTGLLAIINSVVVTALVYCILYLTLMNE